MPKSKRPKIVHTSKVSKDRRALSERLYNNVKEAATSYPYVFVFEVDNMRNRYLKEVRTEFADSRMFMGRTKLMAKSLGRTATDEPVPGISRLTAHMRGQVGLLFTPRQPEDVLSFLDGYAASSFARAGTVATDTVSIPAGVVYLRSAGTPGDTVDDYPLTVTAEPHVRAMGMPTRIERGKVVLDADYDICKEGDVLTGFKASLLRTFGREMARFALRATAYYKAEDHTVVVLHAPSTSADPATASLDLNSDDSLAMDENGVVDIELDE